MKKKMAWLGVAPICGTILSLGGVVHAGDPPETKKKTNIVIQESEALADDILAKVKKELEKSDISDDLKVRILKQVSESLSKKMDEKLNGLIGEKVKKAAAKIVESAKESDGNKEEEITVTVLNDSGHELTVDQKKNGKPHSLNTRILRRIGGTSENFRIGVACSQINSAEGDDHEEKGEESTGGLRIESVVEDSPAGKAGIKKGDILILANAKKLNEIAELTELIQDAGKKDKEVEIELTRDDKNITVTVKPTQMKESDVAIENFELFSPRGWVVNRENVQDQIMSLGGKAGGFIFSENGSADLKKEMEELKSEISELKKMIQELIDKN